MCTIWFDWHSTVEQINMQGESPQRCESVIHRYWLDWKQIFPRFPHGRSGIAISSQAAWESRFKFYHSTESSQCIIHLYGCIRKCSLGHYFTTLHILSARQTHLPRRIGKLLKRAEQALARLRLLLVNHFRCRYKRDEFLNLVRFLSDAIIWFPLHGAHAYRWHSSWQWHQRKVLHKRQLPARWSARCQSAWLSSQAYRCWDLVRDAGRILIRKLHVVPCAWIIW